jgi:hypothetical protein
MNFSIKHQTFDINNIELKECKKCTKLIYKLDFVKLIGIIFKITNYDIIKQFKHIIEIKIYDNEIINNLKLVDNYLKKNFNDYISFLDDNKICIKVNNDYIPNKKLLININNLKKYNSEDIVQIFAL